MRVIVTRPEGQAEPLAGRIRALGHEVVLCPLTRIEPLGDEPIELDGVDWLLVTSVNGAAELARRARGRPRNVAAIGPGTAAALRSAGFRVDLVPQTATQEGLLAELPPPSGRVLFAGAAGARRLLADELGAEFLPLYRTIELSPERPDGDLVVLASASAARAFARLTNAVPAVSIGPETTRAAESAGLTVLAEAEEHDLEGLVAALVRLPGA